MRGRWSGARTLIGTDVVINNPPTKNGSALWTILAVVGIGGAIVALSPGARYFYRHGRLPE